MLVLAAVVVALSGGGRAGPARVSIEAGVPGRPVPSSFLGMSMEWPSVEPFAGPGRPDVVALLRRIEAAARAPRALRVGGASAEEAWWNPSHRPRPPTIRHDIDPATLVAIDRLSRGRGAPVTVGLNLQLGDAANALALAQAAEARFGARLDGLEIGNEPDLYAVARTVGPPAVRRLRKRARYSPEDYVRDAGRYLDVLAARLPVRAHRPRLVIGGFAGRAGWAETLPTLIDAHPRAVGAIAGHRYGLSGCELGFDPAGIRSERVPRSDGEPGAARRARPRPPAAAACRRGQLGPVRRRARRE